MNLEERRLRTFRNWPANAPVEPGRIAQAGFYYCGPGLGVRCFSCDCNIYEWNYGDQVMTRHRTISPDCAFVRNPRASGNVPIPSVPDWIGTSEIDSPRISRRDRGEVGRWESQTSSFRSENRRLESFQGWPVPFIVTPESLAAAGFYFLHQGDKVQCAFCSGIIGHWEEGDVPEVEHRRHFPNCSFLLGLPVGNTPVNIPPPVNERLLGIDSFENLGIRHNPPRHTKYATVESRLRTFTNWPEDLTQRPMELAQAGFFFVGDETRGIPRDQVRCFHCDGGLNAFEPQDEPWHEHARWFPNCSFVRIVKGQEFVDSVQAVYATDGQPKPSPASCSNTLPESKMSRQNGGLSASMPSLSDPQRLIEGSENMSRTHSVTESLTLEEENRRLKEARQCKICMDAEVGAVLLPCGHLVSCVNCAPSLQDCPVCRQQIKATIRTFLS